MDPELFRKQLEQWAELKQMRVPKSAGLREADNPEVIERQGQTLTLETDNNPTVNWCIKKMKPHVAVCEDCHTVVENRVIQIQRYSNPQLHWRRHCTACNLGQNPYNKKYELLNKQAHHYNACYIDGKPEPQLAAEREEKCSILRPVFKKPAK